MVMKILTLHRILDLDHILVRAAEGGWSKDSHQRDLAVQRACEKGTEHGQDGDVQEGTHGDHRRGRVYGCTEYEREKRRGRREEKKRKGFVAQFSSAQPRKIPV